MHAVGYFSESRPSEQACSLSDQNDAFLDTCRQQGYEPTASFLDTALDGDRPGFEQLLNYLGRPDRGFIVVVVMAFAHLGAAQIEAARTYYQLIARGAKVVSIKEGPLDEARLLELWAAASPTDAMRERVRNAMRRRAVSGQVLGRPAYGYRVGPDRRLELVEEEAVVVRHIFSLYLQEGLGVRRIAKRLNEDGFQTRRRANWSMVTIRDILRNRVYLGTYARFGVRVPGSHPAIVSEEDFRKVQQGLERRRTVAAPATRSNYLLSGLAHCDACGNRMIGVSRRQQWTRGNGETVKQTYRYYQCESRTNQSMCDYHTRRADELEAEVVAHVTGAEPGARRPSVISAGNADAVAAETATATARVRGRLRLLDRRLSEQLTRAAAGQLSRDRLRAIADSLVAEHQDAEEELRGHHDRASLQVSAIARRQHQERQVERIRGEWSRLSFAARQAMVRDLVEKVVVSDDEVTTVLRP